MEESNSHHMLSQSKPKVTVKSNAEKKKGTSFTKMRENSKQEKLNCTNGR